MKTKRLSLKMLLSMFSILLILNSCKDQKPFLDFFDEQFPEPTNMSTDIFIDGEIAVPLLNSSFTLGNFIPVLDSSLWIEVDNNNLIHLRMYIKNVAEFTANEIYGNPLPNPILPDSITSNTDTAKLKVYENALSGKLFFFDPKFTFIIKNGIPFVSFFKIDSLRLHSPVYDTVYVRSNRKYIVNAPTQPNTIANTSIIVDKTVFPGFQDFFSPIPKFISLFVTAGNDLTQNHPFSLTGNEKISFDLDIDLPLHARLDTLVFGKTIDFSLDSSMNVEQIKEVKLKLIIDNDFPVKGVAQVQFADTNNNGGIDDIILNLFENDGFVFNSSITNPDGITTSSTRSEIIVTLTQEQVETLQTYHASKVIINAILYSYQSNTGQFVKIMNWYKLKLKLGIKIKYEGNTGDIPQ